MSTKLLTVSYGIEQNHGYVTIAIAISVAVVFLFFILMDIFVY